MTLSYLTQARNRYCADFGIDPADLDSEDWVLIWLDVENRAALAAL